MFYLKLCTIIVYNVPSFGELLCTDFGVLCDAIKLNYPDKLSPRLSVSPILIYVVLGDCLMKWNREFDTRWMVSLFGTAVGAGILYLPIKAGTGGFWPIVVMTFIIFPMVYLSHRALSRFVCQADGDNHDITHAAEDYFGRKVSILITILYFFAIFPICLAYCVGITNTFISFVYYQLLPTLDPAGSLAQLINSYYTVSEGANGRVVASLDGMPRAVLVLVLVSIFMLVMRFSETFVTKVCELLVYPLCAILLLFSLYLIPYWDFSTLSSEYIPPLGEFITVVWLTLPVLVFSFNHSPAISTFAVNVKQRYPENPVAKSNQILFRTAIMLLAFVMFFVFSCSLTLTPDDLAQAKAQNIPVLSYIANKFGSGDLGFGAILIIYGGPAISFLAISSSFFGHYFGAREGAYGIVRKVMKSMGNENPDQSKIAIGCTVVMYVVMLLVAYYNPSVLGFIESLGGPIIAAILFIMPMVAIYTISKLKRFKNPALDAFVFITGLATILTTVVSF